MGLFGTTLDDVRRLIESWKPGKLASEVQYRNGLADFLEAKIKGAQITKEYGKGRLRADLHVKFGGTITKILGDSECFIELKHGLSTRAKFQRLIGQLDQYVQQKVTPLFVVVCGEHDRNSAGDLRDYVRRQNESEVLALAEGDGPLQLIFK